jgi:hypothetical protein
VHALAGTDEDLTPELILAVGSISEQIEEAETGIAVVEKFDGSRGAVQVDVAALRQGLDALRIDRPRRRSR